MLLSDRPSFFATEFLANEQWSARSDRRGSAMANRVTTASMDKATGMAWRRAGSPFRVPPCCI